MAFTGGLLNLLNGKMGISAPHKSVAVMKLIRAHNPVSKNELEDLISEHAIQKCDCGIISQGSVETFGRNLYDAQLKVWGEYKFSLEQCIQWEYDLFITQSLKGGLMERKAIRFLNSRIPDLSFIEADGYIDEELRIDITAALEGKIIAGIQVKPLSFIKMRTGVITFNQNANKKWGKPVFYLFYNKMEEFVNIEELLQQLHDQFSKGV